MSEDKDRIVGVDKCPFASSSFEKIPEGEAVEIDEIARLTTELQDKRIELPKQKGKLLRGVHAKSHGCVTAKFIVNKDIDCKYQIGLFAKPGASYDAHIRYSNASVEIDADSTFIEGDETAPHKWQHGSRGMATKVYDVEGDVIDEDCNGQKNQDFLMINTPEFAFSDVHSYLFLTRALTESKFGNNSDTLFALGKITLDVIIKGRGATSTIPTQVDFDRLVGFLNSDKNQAGFKLPDGFTLQDLQKVIATLVLVAGKIQKQIVRNPTQIQYFGASPFLFGEDKVMKFSVAPTTPIEQKELELTSPENVSDDYLLEALSKTMSEDCKITYDFKILLRDSDFGEDQLLIEDATTTWVKEGVEEIDQYVTVAKLIIDPKQDISTEAALKRCESLVFSPWHALKSHEPVGSINRLRRSVYDNSAKHRGR